VTGSPDPSDATPEPAREEPPPPLEAGAEPRLAPSEPAAADQPRPIDEATGAEPETPLPEVAVPPPPAVQSTRRLIGASFDLLGKVSDPMRRASFYIGGIVLGTVGPFALASLALEVFSLHRTRREYDAMLGSGTGAAFGLLGIVAVLGLLVAAVESRTMATAILGGAYADRPIDVKQALARSRMVFWRAIIAAVIVSIPVTFATNVVNAVLERAVGASGELSLVAAVIVAAVVGAPLAYLLTGIVLGDVDPAEATRRSFRVFRARKLAAVLVAVFESLAILLVVLGLGAGLDIALRIFDAIGIGTESGPAGLALLAIGVVVGVFALGTLIFTALAISLAPQVVMFVGLTRATGGLDHVRPGRDHDPLVSPPTDRRQFRWLPIPMCLGIAAGIVGLSLLLVALQG
jgi:hypothetical protein